MHVLILSCVHDRKSSSRVDWMSRLRIESQIDNAPVRALQLVRLPAGRKGCTQSGSSLNTSQSRIHTQPSAFMRQSQLQPHSSRSFGCFRGSQSKQAFVDRISKSHCNTKTESMQVHYHLPSFVEVSIHSRRQACVLLGIRVEIEVLDSTLI